MTKKTEAKTVSKEVAVVEETPIIGQPGVIAVNGEILTAIGEAELVDGWWSHNGFPLIRCVPGIGPKGAYPVLKVYRYLHDIEQRNGLRAPLHYILADESSSLDLSGLSSYTPYGTKDPLVVICLIDSHSKSDYFAGRSVLMGIDSTENAWDESIVRNGFYGVVRRPEGRLSLSGVDADTLNFQGTSLPSGYYCDSLIEHCSFVRGVVPDSFVTVNNSDLRHCNFREGKIDIEDSRLIGCGFFLTGNVTLKGIRFNSQNFRQDCPGIYLTSRYDFTVINIGAPRPAHLVRVDENNVALFVPKESANVFDQQYTVLFTMSFRNPDSRRSIRRKACQAFFGDVEPSAVEESLVDYLVDSITSRCSMINLLDTARRLINNELLTVKYPPKEREDLMLSTSPKGNAHLSYPDKSAFDYLANENEQTIYIDGATF